ncbi:hypothetical protein JTE90_017023 [Oedothorax gibbosus]|uniref:Uncharacterized protein n=1 Tax=Oedothorax gibbosus TaxID=931172 RepID=A0AAV6ULI4_9ARAC|nr:hypothetical protein JTE90_017023 [Oedothorax gibbosus]
MTRLKPLGNKQWVQLVTGVRTEQFRGASNRIRAQQKVPIPTWLRVKAAVGRKKREGGLERQPSRTLASPTVCLNAAAHLLEVRLHKSIVGHG